MPRLELRAEACRAHAQKCRDGARLASDQRSRDQFLDLAQQWETMAVNAEELEDLRQRLSVSPNEESR
jgi:hypothetical protein